MALTDTIDGSKVEAHRPWPRVVVGEAGWRAVAAELSAGRLTLLGLWGERSAAHMAVLDEETAEIAVVTIECPRGSFPSVGALHPPAIRLERALHDLYGLIPEGLPDTRPWLDHGRWGARRPLGAREDRDQKPPPYAFLPAEGESLHQIPVGPVHAGVIEPGHFRFTANGETVVRLEERLGYVAQGRRVADNGSGRSTRRRGSRPASPATAPSPTASLSRGRSRPRWKSRRLRAQPICAP